MPANLIGHTFEAMKINIESNGVNLDMDQMLGDTGALCLIFLGMIFWSCKEMPLLLNVYM